MTSSKTTNRLRIVLGALSLIVLLAAGCMQRPSHSQPLVPIELNARQVLGPANPTALQEAINQRARELEAEGVDPRTARAMAAAEFSRDVIGPVPRTMTDNRWRAATTRMILKTSHTAMRWGNGERKVIRRIKQVRQNRGI